MSVGDWFDEIRKQYAAELPERVARIRRLARAGGDADEALLRALHQLAGSAGSHGFEAVGTTARDWEQAIRDGTARDDEARLAALVAAAERELRARLEETP